MSQKNCLNSYWFKNRLHFRMADETLRELFLAMMAARSSRAEAGPSSSNAAGSSSSSSGSMQRDALFSLLRSSMMQSRSRGNDSSDDEESFGRSQMGSYARRPERSRRERDDPYGDDFYRNSKRDPRRFGRRNSSSDDELPSSTKLQCNFRENKNYVNIMTLFERPAFHLRRKGWESRSRPWYSYKLWTILGSRFWCEVRRVVACPT